MNYNPDFTIEIPLGKKPVILQLSDPQIIDPTQSAPPRMDEFGLAYWHPTKIEKRCFSIIRETVEKVKPDLITIAGDLIYGEFCLDGKPLVALVEFMESLGIPWAPVLGNHETESPVGIDWICARLENAKNCLFKQRTLTGNSNFTVGIKQGDKLLRVFYFVDSNLGAPTPQSLANGHTRREVGFADDQIEWYTNDVKALKTAYPDSKISFTFHVPINAFAKAYEKYGYSSTDASVFPIDIDSAPNKAQGDFGYINAKFNTWDGSDRIWQALKNLGVDNICVGHDHEVLASVVYEGVRLQFGLKSSTYDSNLYKNADGKLVRSYLANGCPVVGGTVMELSPDGAIDKAYNYYCQNLTFETMDEEMNI